MPAPFREETEEPIENIAPLDDRLPSYDTAIDEPLGSSRRLIEVNSDDDQICHGCRGNHNWKRCDRLYKYNKEADDYLPIPDIPPTKLSDIVPGITRIDFDAPFPSSSSTPCRRCLETGHVEEDCDTPIRSVYRCEVCDWEKRSQFDCPHVDFPTPAFVKRTNEMIVARNKK